MAVAEPCCKKEWEEWKREMEEKRRRRWTQKVSCWGNLEVSSSEEEVEEEQEEEAIKCEENEEKEEAAARGENEVRVKVRWSEEEVVQWEEGEDDNELFEVMEEGGRNDVDVEENERAMDGKVEEGLIKAEDDEEDQEDEQRMSQENDSMEQEQEKLEDRMEEVVQWEEGENGNDVFEVMEEGGRNDVDIEENERTMDGKVEEGLIKAEDMEEEQQGEQRRSQENDRMEQEQEKLEDRMEEEDRGAEPQTCVAELQVVEEDEEDEVDEVENQVNERVRDAVKIVDVKVHNDEEQRELEQTGEHNLANQDNNKRSEVEEDEEADNYKEEDHYKDRINDEEQAEILNEQSHEKSLLEGHSKFMKEAGMVAQPPTGDLKDPEEEEDSDEEEASEEEDDEDVFKTYCVDGYPSELFSALKDFREASLLTDLTLSTADGSSLHVHAVVLAAVSAHIRQRLRERTAEISGTHISLGPEVDAVGLAAVVEFAYAGSVSALGPDTVHRVEAAAGALGAFRVMDLCRQSVQEEGASGKPEDRQEEEQEVTLRAIEKMRTDKVGCDVILEAIGGSLHVHRVILAVCSDYFRCMFTSGMKECRQPAVSLPSLPAPELESLIKCSYSGDLPLSWSCVFEITSTALQLQHLPALRLGLDFMQREINPLSCLDVASFAEAYALAELLDVSHDYVLRHFQKVASTSKFKDLPAEQLLRYLNSHSLCVPSELSVFRAVAAWIRWKPKKRQKLAKELMKTIHFPLMTYKEFKEVQSSEMWSDPGLEELYETIFEDFCGSEAAPQIQYRTYQPKESLVVIGGEQTFEELGSRRISKELWFANSIRHHTGIKKATEWRMLTEMPDQGRFSHQVAVLKGQLYVFGGKKYYGTNDTLNSVYRYDPLRNRWENVAPMQEKRCSFSAVVLDGKIFAIGGHCDPDNIESVERYCPLANTWSYTLPLDLPLSAHAANILHGQVFVSGGLTDDFRCLASMFAYQPQTGSTYLANMVQPRAQHCMEVLGEQLYVAGGITKDDSAPPFDLLACEMYYPAFDCWVAFASLPVPHVGAGSAVLEGKFYVLGGYNQEDYSNTLMVHRYDPAAQSWENTGNTPGPNNDIRASVLRLPPHLRV